MLSSINFDQRNCSLWNLNKIDDMSTSQVHSTPRPTPQFLQQPSTFSTKKSRACTPRDCPPPRPPVKSAPPVSRIFAPKTYQKARPISFKLSPEESTLSPCYNAGKKDLYFEQCFEIENKLGAGSFGEVFKVRSKEDGKRYAIKRSVEKFKGESDRKRKLGEVSKHENLPYHPNCVGFVKAWEEKQHLYIQTELCRTSLSAYAEHHHNFTEKLIWKYMVDLLMAIKHLHDHDLVHMDIKPDNIFIAEDTNTCKLGDFGLVLDVQSGSDLSDAQEGDPKYLSPELMQGKFGKAADVFSLGITILELASDLDLPRGGDLWHHLRSGQLPEEFLMGISEELKTIIRLMMDPTPEKRPCASEVLAHPLVHQVHHIRKRQRAIKHLGVEPTGLETPPPPRSKERRLSPNARANTLEWEDYSFSDEDMEGVNISINNNSMGFPLDSSTSSISSDDLGREPEGFALANRRALTTPAFGNNRVRSFMRLDSPAAAAGARPSFFSSSPVDKPKTLADPPRAFTPDSQTQKTSTTINCTNSSSKTVDRSDKGDPKVNISPKNLMSAFLFNSSSDDEEM